MCVRPLYITLLLIIFLALPSTFISASTATHAYDELNRLVQTVYDTGLKVTTIDYSYDPAGNMLNFTVISDHLIGDVDDSQGVDLVDAVLCLQIVSGGSPSTAIYQSADIDGDNRISTAELLYVLQKVAGLR